MGPLSGNQGAIFGSLRFISDYVNRKTGKSSAEKSARWCNCEKSTRLPVYRMAARQCAGRGGELLLRRLKLIQLTLF